MVNPNLQLSGSLTTTTLEDHPILHHPMSTIQQLQQFLRTLKLLQFNILIIFAIINSRLKAQEFLFVLQVFSSEAPRGHPQRPIFKNSQPKTQHRSQVSTKGDMQPMPKYKILVSLTVDAPCINTNHAHIEKEKYLLKRHS